MVNPVCHHLGTIMFSHNYNRNWGCRCCTTSDRHFRSNGNWDVYQVSNAPPIAPGPPTLPPSLPSPSAPAGSMWTIVSGAAYCSVTADAAGNAGQCVTDGVGAHGNAERCTIAAAAALYATAPYFQTET